MELKVAINRIKIAEVLPGGLEKRKRPGKIIASKNPMLRRYLLIKLLTESNDTDLVPRILN
jgi:hypothetical protein